MAAFFLGHEPGKRMSHLKLMKLLYLAEREAVRRFGFPMAGDHLVSMPHGPVLSKTLNLMDGDTESHPGGWEDWISDKENHEVALRHAYDLSLLDELAPDEISAIESVWAAFGGMDKWAIRDWTHKQSAEWKDPNGSSFPIQYETLARALGFDECAAKELAARIESERDVNRLLATI